MGFENRTQFSHYVSILNSFCFFFLCSTRPLVTKVLWLRLALSLLFFESKILQCYWGKIAVDHFWKLVKLVASSGIHSQLEGFREPRLYFQWKRKNEKFATLNGEIWIQWILHRVSCTFFIRITVHSVQLGVLLQIRRTVRKRISWSQLSSREIEWPVINWRYIKYVRVQFEVWSTPLTCYTLKIDIVTLKNQCLMLILPQTRSPPPKESPLFWRKFKRGG